jgi:hypothetical protein
VNGGGAVIASAANTGEGASPTKYGSATTLGSSSFDLKSAGSGFVDTIYGGAMGEGTSGVSGTSSELVKGIDNSLFNNGNNFGVFGESISGGSSVASAAGAFDGKFTPLGASGETGGLGSGTGSLKVTGSGTVDKVPDAFSPYNIGATSGGGTAQTSAGGSVKGFNDMTTAGGRGSGSAQGNATGAINAPAQLYIVNADSASTGTFTGIGSGSSGNASNQPYSGGFVNGKGSGAGTAVVSGLVDYAFVRPVKTGGDAAFKSNGDGAGFVDSTNGGAVGTASADISGAAAGKTGSVRIDDGMTRDVTRGQFSVSSNSVANGEGAFTGGFSPPQAAGPTGGSGSGTGSLEVAGAGTGVPRNGPSFFLGTAVGSGKAQTSSGGSATGFNDLGSAGGLGSGASQGSANGAINVSNMAEASNVAGNVTGTFNNAGSGSFGLPSTSLAFP